MALRPQASRLRRDVLPSRGPKRTGNTAWAEPLRSGGREGARGTCPASAGERLGRGWWGRGEPPRRRRVLFRGLRGAARPCLGEPAASPGSAPEPEPELFSFFFLNDIFREKGREGDREGEKHQCVVVSRAFFTGDPARSPGLCPDWELNL